MNGVIVEFDGTITFDEPWASRETLALSLTFADGSTFDAAEAYYVALVDNMTTLAVSAALTHSSGELTLTGTINLNTTELVTDRMDDLGADSATYRINIVTANKDAVVLDDIVVLRTEWYYGAPSPTQVAAMTFLSLDDTPSAYTGQAGKYPKVNTGEDALEFDTPSGSGDVVGPASATDNAFPRYNLTTGKLIQDGTTTEDDSGNVDVQGNITVSGTTDGRDVATDGSKLDGVEALADVTDAANIEDAITGSGAVTDPTSAGVFSVIISAVLKKITWANMVATLTTAFDALYAAISHAGTHITGQSDAIQSATNAQNGLSTAAQVTAQEANTAKVTNATHTGDVTGSGALTIGNKVTMTATSPVAVTNSPTVIAAGAVAISMPAATNASAGHSTAAQVTAQEAATAHITATANPHATDIENLGAGTLAELNAAVSDATLIDTADARLSDARTPSAHKDSHDPNDGSDALDTAAAAEISVVVAAGAGTSHSLAAADHIHAINHAITDNHLVTVDGTTNAPVDNDYAKWTTLGLEGRTYAEVRTDINVADGAAADVWTTFSDTDIDIIDSPATLATIAFVAGESTTWHVKGEIKKTSSQQAFDALLSCNAVDDGYGGWNYTVALSMVRLAEIGDCSDVTFFDGSDATLSTQSATNVLFKATVATGNWQIAGKYMQVTAL